MVIGKTLVEKFIISALKSQAAGRGSGLTHYAMQIWFSSTKVKKIRVVGKNKGSSYKEVKQKKIRMTTCRMRPEAAGQYSKNDSADHRIKR